MFFFSLHYEINQPLRCTDNGKKTTYTAGLLKNLIIQEHLDEVRIDDSSVANGVTDILLENAALRKKVIPIKFGERARKHPDRFANIASEGYWDLGQLIKNH